MQGIISVLMILALILGGGAYLYSQRADQIARQEVQANLHEAHAVFADKARAALVRENPEDYLAEMKAALRSYKQDLETVVYASRPDWFDVEAQKKLTNQSLDRGEVTESRHRGMMEGYEFVRAAYDTLMTVGWQPDLTLQGRGDTRLDIYQFKRIRGPDGSPLLEARFFLWGIEPLTPLSFGQVVLEYWQEDKPDPQTRRRRRREGRDPNAPVWRLMGQAEGDARPHILIKEPQKRIAQFPSFVAIGSLWFPQIPRDAKVMDLRYDYSIRRNGQSHHSVLSWKKMPIPPKWQLSEGEQWMAEEIEATEEELIGFDPDESN